MDLGLVGHLAFVDSILCFISVMVMTGTKSSEVPWACGNVETPILQVNNLALLLQSK
jgi:hypothetical protein